MGNLWKALTKLIKQAIYYHREMVEPNKYINNIETSEHQLTIQE